MKSKLLSILAPALLVAFVLVGCPGPAVYGTKLVACSELAKTYAEYQTCCEAVAREKGRDPSFCARDDAFDASSLPSLDSSVFDANHLPLGAAIADAGDQ